MIAEQSDLSMLKPGSMRHLDALRLRISELEEENSELREKQDHPTPRLVTADELRRYVATCRWPRQDGYTHARIADITSLSAGFVGMVLSGAREPSKAFLDAAGFERVVLYRLKSDTLEATTS